MPARPFSAGYAKLRRSRDNLLSYNLTRGYNFSEVNKWLIFVVFTLLLVPISVFNIAANGWDMQPVFTDDPNTTESQRHWYQNSVLQFGDDKLIPKCQSAELRSGDRFSTSNLGMTYTVTNVQLDEHRSGQFQTKSSLLYKNNTLQNCNVQSVEIALTKTNQQAPAQINLTQSTGWWGWGLQVVAHTQCSIDTTEGMYELNFDQPWLFLHGNFDYVVLNNPSHASIWWGTRILDGYAFGLLYLMAGNLGLDLSQFNLDYTVAHMIFSPNKGASIRGTDPFTLQDYWFILALGGIDNKFNPRTDKPFNNEDFGSFWLSRAATEGLFIVKALTSLILTDLGNNEPANFLLDPDLVQYALNPTDDFNRVPGGPLNLTQDGQEVQFDWQKLHGISPPGVFDPDGNNATTWHEAFEKYASQTGPLGTFPATISQPYLCTVPQRKGWTTIVIFVILADFVTMQAIWALFKVWADHRAEKTVENPTYCEGCLAGGKAGPTNDVELKPQSYTRAGSTESLIEDREALQPYHGPLGSA